MKSLIICTSLCLLLAVVRVEAAFSLVPDVLQGVRDGFKDTLTKFKLPIDSLDVTDRNVVADPVDIIKWAGYKSVTSVNVTTEDGYILTLWRIKCPRNIETCDQGPPVLLQHGLLLTGADWLFLDKDSVLPFMLADKGMDVYIGNARGNRYSRAHLNLSTTEFNSDYWKFGVNEMGTQDLPAVIDSIIKLTGKPQIRYIGYSMGTTMYFICMSENPDYRKKIEYAVALAPAAFIDNLSAPLRLLSVTGVLGIPQTVASLALDILNRVDGPITDSAALTGPLAEELSVIRLVSTLKNLKNLVDAPLQFFLAEAAAPIKNPTAFLRALGHAPGGASIRTVAHYVQLFSSKTFGRFQFRTPEENSAKYKGNVFPGLYTVQNDETPLLVFAGTADSLVVPSDARKTTLMHFGGSGLVAYCPIKDFNHLDFVYGPNEQVKRMNEYIIKYFETPPEKFNLDTNCPSATTPLKRKPEVEGKLVGLDEDMGEGHEAFFNFNGVDYE